MTERMVEPRPSRRTTAIISTTAGLAIAVVITVFLFWVQNDPTTQEDYTCGSTPSEADVGCNAPPQVEWEPLSEALEGDEVTFPALRDRFFTFKSLENSGVSVRKRSKLLSRINQESVYAFVAFRVAYISRTPRGTLELGCEAAIYDPRSGKFIGSESRFVGGSAFLSRQDMSPAAVDKHSSLWLQEMRNPDVGFPVPTHSRFIDYEYARKLDYGDAIVCRVTLYIGKHEQPRYIAVPVRKLALTNL